MALGTKRSSRARYLALLALLASSATAAVLGARVAVAQWQPAATRSYGSGRVRITSNGVHGLYPGATRELVLTLHNGDRHHDVRIRRVHVRDIATTKRGCAPSRGNLRIRQYTEPPLRIPPRGARRVVVRLTMPNTVADACQRAVFKLHYTAQTTANSRPR